MGLFFDTNKALKEAHKANIDSTIRHMNQISESSIRWAEVVANLETMCEQWQKAYWKAARELAELKGEVYIPDWREGQK